jgi:hypothetical protein
MREVIGIDGVSVENGNRGPYHKVRVVGQKGGIFCFEHAVGTQLMGLIGQNVAVDVDRTPNPNTGKVFPKITAFLGAADPSSEGATAPVVAGSSGAATGSRGGGVSQGTPGWNAQSAKKDPLGLVTSLRQTSLNAAVAYYGYWDDRDNADPQLIIKVARQFYAYLSEGLPLDV